MSYEIVKTIKLKEKENKILITSACNNVRPLYFEEWEYRGKENDWNEKLFKLFNDLLDGNLQMQKSCSKKIRFALNKVLETYEDRNCKFDDFCNNEKYYFEFFAKEMGLNDYQYDYTKVYKEDKEIHNKICKYIQDNVSEEKRKEIQEISVHKNKDDKFKIFQDTLKNGKMPKETYVIAFEYSNGAKRYIYKINEKTYKYVWNIDGAKQYDCIEIKRALEIVKSCINDNAVAIQLA